MGNTDLSDQIRQTLLVGFVGTEASEVAPFLRELRPAGLALLPRNIRSAQQVADLCGGLQALAESEGLPPLIIAVDQEGGAVARLSSAAGFTDLPGAMAVARSGDRAAARELAAMAGRELASVGVNMDLAPVADLALDPRNSVIGTRSFGADPVLVSEMVVAYIEGLRAAGVLACAKHFPGHGATHVDSHLSLPRLEATVEDLERRDLQPFRAAIAAGCAAIMTAHVVSPVDAGVPATLSRRTLTDLLRGGLGYDGLVLTDALEMRALAETALERWQTGAEALRAGADLIVFEGDAPLIRASVAWIEREVEREELDPAFLAGTAGRLGTARAAMRPSGGSADVGTDEHWQLARRSAAAGIRIEDTAGVLPLARPPIVLDVGRGRSFADALRWPLAPPVEVVAGQAAAVVLADADDRAPDIDAAIAELERRAVPFVVVVLGGWSVPDGLPASAATTLALDLPAGLWPCIAERLIGAPAISRGSPGA